MQTDKVEIKSLPDDDDLKLVTYSIKETLMKTNLYDLNQIAEIIKQKIWSNNPDDWLDDAIGTVERNKGDVELFKKIFNREIIRKQKRLMKDSLKQERKLFSGRMNPQTIYENVEEFHKESPFFYDKNQIFWFWIEDEWKWKIVDETDLLNMIEKSFEMKGAIVTTTLLNKYIKAFQAIGRLNKPLEPNKYWIQFKNKVFDIKTKEMFDVSTKYFFCNPLPYDIGKTNDTPVMDKLFQDWVGEKYIKTLYQFIAYCCYKDYPIHTIFCMIGSGRNGKSSFLKILNKFIGQDNSCSTELDDLLESRFESAKLFKKLVCVMGETNFGTMSKTSLIKKLTGQDLIGFEYKNKMPFDDFNYAKIVIASNSLPVSTDTSEGFYRRWMILDFNNQFPEGKDIVEIIPEEEYSNLARKITELLPELLNKGSFDNQGTIEERQQKYIQSSNPLSLFIEEYCEHGFECYVRNSELYKAYFEYLNATKKRTIKLKAFHQLLAEEGIEVEHTQRNGENGRFAIGIKLKDNWKDMIKEKMTKMPKMTDTTLNTYIYQPIDKRVISVISVIEDKSFINRIRNSPRIFQPCSFCDSRFDVGAFLLGNGKVICEMCLENEDVLNSLKGVDI